MSKSKTWHENDDFWETMAPRIFGAPSWEAAPIEVDRVIALVGIEPGAKVLDLCCGPGRHSLELAHRGYHMTGVDRTDAYLKQAREKAEAGGLSIEFVQDDMRLFCRPDSFDAVLNLFTSFGYFEDPAENQHVLANAYRSLKMGGRLIMEMMGKEILARIFEERGWWEQEGVTYLEERKIIDGWTRIENRWIKLQGQVRHEFTLSHWLYSAAELTTMPKEAGFSAVDVYGDSEGAPYDHTAKRLVALAHK
jgi:ubiquinone/menaquinone biosynthesis C-methylase UbiE